METENTSIENVETTVADPVENEVVESAETPAEDTEFLKLKRQLEQERLAKKKAEDALTLEKKSHAALKRAQMSEAEQASERLKEVEAQAQMYKVMTNKSAAMQIFTKGGLVEEDYSEWIDQLVTDDAEKTTALAQGVVDLLKAKTSMAAKAEREKVLKETPVPQGGGTKTADPFLEGFNQG